MDPRLISLMDPLDYCAVTATKANDYSRLRG